VNPTPRVDVPPSRCLSLLGRYASSNGVAAHASLCTMAIKRGCRASSLAPSRPIALRGVVQTLYYSPRGLASPGLSTCLSTQGSGPRWAKPIKEESTPVRGGKPTATVSMMIMRVLVEEFLCQGLLGQKPVLECLSVRCTWVLAATSCHARI
jgi:hypothetical protein